MERCGRVVCPGRHGYCQDLWSLFQRRLVSTVAGVQAPSKQGLGFTGVGGNRKERAGPWVYAEV